jgi:8-oxo-dGTP pyrophosphatase MutT (NUDIX family)
MLQNATKRDERRKIISCGTAVYRRHPECPATEILLVKQFKTKEGWGIPKGRIQRNETYEQCAIRETREETGIEVSLEHRLGDVKAHYKRSEKTVITFLAQQVCDRQPDVNDVESEVVDAKWFRLDELPLIYSYQRPLIKEVVETLQQKFGECA